MIGQGEIYGKRRIYGQPARHSLNDQAGEAAKHAHSHHSLRLGRLMQLFSRCRNRISKIGSTLSGCRVFDSSCNGIAVNYNVVMRLGRGSIYD